MKIAIYTICKNESNHIQRWADSNSEADYRLVCDTGSTDNTVSLFPENVVVIPIAVSPWRFDIARGTSLNLLPSDIDVCIWQDLDEELLPGWRKQIEDNWKPDTTIANHRYRHNDGPWQWHSKIHARHGCTWTGAVHETLNWRIPESTIWLPELYLDEHQDVTKPRSSYVNLLEKKVSEGDNNWRTLYFLANEYQSVDILKSIQCRIKSYNVCDEGDVVKAYISKHIANSYATIQNDKEAINWFNTSIQFSERESLYDYAKFLFNTKRYAMCYAISKLCLESNSKRDGFTYNPEAWGENIQEYLKQSLNNI